MGKAFCGTKGRGLEREERLHWAWIVMRKQEKRADYKRREVGN